MVDQHPGGGTGLSPLVVNGMTIAQAARWYLEAGLRPIPWIVADGKKIVPLRGFHYDTYEVTQVDLDAWAPHWQVGLAMGRGYWALDVDDQGELSRWETEHGAGLPLERRGWRQSSGRVGGGEHRLYHGFGWEPRHGKFDARYQHLEVISNGLLAVSPSVHPSGRQYLWVEGMGLDTAPPLLLSYLQGRELRRSTSVGGGDGGYDDDGDDLDIGAALRGQVTGGHDTFLARLVFQQMLRGQPMEAIAVLWQAVASRVQDPARPFTPADFDRHARGARDKIGYVEPASDQMMSLVHRWRQDSLSGMSNPDLEEAIALDDELAEVEQVKRRLRIQERARRELRADEYDPPPGEALELLSQGLLRPARERRFMIESLLGERHNGTIAAQYKAGKTTLMGNLLVSLADGVPFLGGLEVAQLSGRVGIWNCEMEADDLYDYLRTLGCQHPERVAVANLRGSRVPLLSSDDAADWARTWLCDQGVQVWLNDSWARLCAWSGINENKNDEVAKLCALLDEIKRQAGVHVFHTTVHTGRGHAEEGAEHGRGATFLDDWADARWVLTRQGRDRFLYAEGRQVGLPETALEWDGDTRRVTLGEGDRAAGRRNVGISEVAEIVERTPGELSLRGLIEVVRQEIPGLGNQVQIQAVVREAVRQGAIHWRLGGRTGSSHIYWPGPSADAEMLRNMIVRGGDGDNSA